MTDHEQLVRLLAARSARRGNFTLASGRQSSLYIDARLTTMTPEGQRLIGRLGLAAMRDAGWQPDAVGGLTLGADPIVAVVAALSHQQGGPPISAFIVRKEAKQHGTQQLVEGWRGQPGDPVVIAEDTCTTGGSLIRAIEQATAAGMKVIAAICLVDREEGGREAIEKYCPFHALFTARELLAAVPISDVASNR